MSRRLAVNVVLQDPVTQVPRVFVAGDEVPEWAAGQIDNPAVWEMEQAEPVVGDGEAPAEPKPTRARAPRRRA